MAGHYPSGLAQLSSPMPKGDCFARAGGELSARRQIEHVSAATVLGRSRGLSRRRSRHASLAAAEIAAGTPERFRVIDTSDNPAFDVAGTPPSGRPSIASLVRTARTKDLGMTQKAFAAAVGLDCTSLSALENGARPSKRTVERIASFLGRHVRELDPDGWAFDRQAPSRVNAAARSAQHAALIARAHATDVRDRRQ